MYSNCCTRRGPTGTWKRGLRAAVVEIEPCCTLTRTGRPSEAGPRAAVWRESLLQEIIIFANNQS